MFSKHFESHTYGQPFFKKEKFKKPLIGPKRLLISKDYFFPIAIPRNKHAQVLAITATYFHPPQPMAPATKIISK
jgi:hypothetical protein